MFESYHSSNEKYVSDFLNKWIKWKIKIEWSKKRICFFCCQKQEPFFHCNHPSGHFSFCFFVSSLPPVFKFSNMRVLQNVGVFFLQSFGRWLTHTRTHTFALVTLHRLHSVFAVLVGILIIFVCCVFAASSKSVTTLHKNAVRIEWLHFMSIECDRNWSIGNRCSVSTRTRIVTEAKLSSQTPKKKTAAATATTSMCECHTIFILFSPRFVCSFNFVCSFDFYIFFIFFNLVENSLVLCCLSFFFFFKRLLFLWSSLLDFFHAFKLILANFLGVCRFFTRFCCFWTFLSFYHWKFLKKNVNKLWHEKRISDNSRLLYIDICSWVIMEKSSGR